MGMAEEATGPSVSLRETMPEWSEVERTAEDAGLSKLQAAEQGHLSEETLQLQRALVRPRAP